MAEPNFTVVDARNYLTVFSFRVIMMEISIDYLFVVGRFNGGIPEQIRPGVVQITPWFSYASKVDDFGSFFGFLNLNSARFRQQIRTIWLHHIPARVKHFCLPTVANEIQHILIVL